MPAKASGLASPHRLLGKIYRTGGNIGTALSHFSPAIQMLDETGDLLASGNTLRRRRDAIMAAGPTFEKMKRERDEQQKRYREEEAAVTKQIDCGKSTRSAGTSFASTPSIGMSGRYCWRFSGSSRLGWRPRATSRFQTES
jgi:hypothetical protein